ncbi:putative disease resistance protein At3g14460 [Juglans microcarpa x Juglans regia]|uniref:putative disease resistance protein At3g14460 n=1 Tax=Juglans microcarpa x Juglans regia TaxID=2249226 RepID=UPI001B7E8334|nr:putative disease resistance protein At3g14460 [Juglans microcarpa x Juglans regia]
MNLQSLEQHGGDLVISEIEIRRCPNFVSFPKGGLRAPNLADFILDDCESLRSMPDKMHLFLPSLHFLELRDCPEVESFPEGGLPSNLKEIMICRCKKLIANWKGWGLQILSSLAWLNIVGESENVESFPGELLLPPTLTSLKIHSFEKLKSFPGELLLPNLTSLKIDSFENLKSLDKEGFQYLTSLVQLEIRKCPKLKYMPEEGFPASLCFLQIENCHHLLEKELARQEGKEWLKVARVPNIMIGRNHIQGYEFPGEFD